MYHPLTSHRSPNTVRVKKNMNHKDLEVCKQAMLLVEKIYTLTDGPPTKETYGLISQMRRAVVSVPSNIAEGLARKSDKELV